ncbi:hypothetical protein [Ammoniphilus sp. CFH 90114]|uniref:hypothetical protein n=1 Tax=Ammoniphilus sp. CFH 90114 TaxID=2493665 RepID=UPI0013E906FA|nr:hypothetical protein [Ammoniphilus sp. CFH 90114]
MNYDLSRMGKEQSTNDKAFIEMLKSSVATAERLIEELELELLEAQGHDELHEVKEMMNQTHQDLLYIWNKVNNDHKPDHPELKKLQAKFVYLIGQYRLGISTELEGMETGDPARLKEGYQTSMEARLQLQALFEDAQELW